MISSEPEKPYYLRKKGMCPAGCYIRIGSSKDQMTTEMIDNLYAKRVRNSLNKIESPRQDLTFKQLKIYYEGQGSAITNNFESNLELVMDNDTVENKRSAKITPKTRIEKTLVDSKALKEAIINAIDYSSGKPQFLKYTLIDLLLLLWWITTRNSSRRFL